MEMGRGEKDEVEGSLRSAGGLETDFMKRLRLQFRFEKDRRLQQLQLDVRRNYTLNISNIPYRDCTRDSKNLYLEYI
jgi:hypothetical protein